MALIFPSAAPHSVQISQISQISLDNEFYGVVDRLKAQDALPLDCFLNGVPFFNLHSLPKEMHVRELFEKSCEPELCRHLLRNVAPISERVEHNLIPQNHSAISVMSFAQIVLYKVLPCPNVNRTCCPREVATHNQYKDFEYECPFYHHEKDRRRLVIYDDVNKEFVYKANYFEERRRKGDKDKYSQNYFESMFHPLYYKMFRCKRDFCNLSPCCPFFHSELEKNAWDEIFRNFIKKDRVSYIKDKPAPTHTQNKLSKVQVPGRKPSNDMIINAPEENIGKWFMGPQGTKLYTEFMMNNTKSQFMPQRKGSDSSFEENQTNDRFFSRLQASTGGYNIY